MEERKYTVYKFNELPEESKQKAIKKHWDINIDYEWWNNETLLEPNSKQIEKIKEFGFKFPAKHGIETLDEKGGYNSRSWYQEKNSKKIYYNNSNEIPSDYYPFHTGLFKYKNIYFDLDRSPYIQFDHLMVECDTVFYALLQIPKKYWEFVSYSFENPSRHFTKIVIEFDCSEYETKFENEEIPENEIPEIEKMLDKATENWDDIVDDAWKTLRDEYEYKISEKAIAETLIANEYDFTIDGDID